MRVYVVELDGFRYDGFYSRVAGRYVPFSLVEAMRSVYGCAGARVLRADGTRVVEEAGNASVVRHVPSGRRLVRRSCRAVGRT